MDTLEVPTIVPPPKQERASFTPLPEPPVPKVRAPYVYIPRRQKKQPTLKQIKAVQYKNEGMSARQAMLKAGYSKSSANVSGRAFTKSQGVKNILQSMVGKIEDKGLSLEYMAGKFQEWLEAQQTGQFGTQADYNTQIKAYDRWEKIMGLNSDPSGKKGKVKREMTITEFVTGEKDTGDQNDNDS